MTAYRTALVKLQISKSIFYTLLLAIAILTSFVTTCEVVARIPAIRKHLPVPALGLGRRSFAVQRERLQKYLRHHGHVDCFFVGNSSVRHGIDPQIFAEAYQRETETQLNCFNFSISGLDIDQLPPIAEFLIREYNPRLIVYGLTPHVNRKRPSLINTPWMQYKLGNSNFDGWLIENSQAYRYYLLTHLPPKQRTITLGATLAQAPYGYVKSEEVAIDIEQMPDFTNRKQRKQARRFRKLYPLTEYRRSLQQLVKLHNKVELAFVRMPIHPTISYYMDDVVRKQFKQLSKQLSATFRAVDVLLLESERTFAAGHWLDRGHINAYGAKIFSNWLAVKLAKTINKKELQLPPAKKP